jgi:transposase
LLQLHRLREHYKRTRNARLNLLRGALRELGVLVPKGLRDNLPGFQRALRAPSTPLPVRMRRVYRQVLDEVQQLQAAMDSIEARQQSRASLFGLGSLNTCSQLPHG